jgi:hypothetical protein
LVSSLKRNFQLNASNLAICEVKVKREAANTNLEKAQEFYTAQGNTTGAEQAANFLQQLP